MWILIQTTCLQQCISARSQENTKHVTLRFIIKGLETTASLKATAQPPSFCWKHLFQVHPLQEETFLDAAISFNLSIHVMQSLELHVGPGTLAAFIFTQPSRKSQPESG